MIRRLLAVTLAAITGFGACDYSTTRAAPPVITNVAKTRIYTSAYNYRLDIDQADTITATPRDTGYLPTVDGAGCHLDYHVNTRNHAKIIDRLYCDQPGWVQIRTTTTYTCGLTFTLTAATGADVSTYTDPLTAPCPPPTPSVSTTVAGDQVTFTNPANIAQPASYGRSIPSLACTFTGDLGFPTTTSTRFAGVGPNTYVYYWAFTTGTIPAASTVALSLVCPP